MIRNYSDHAANERTFLAWVRTAIAVMAFGFVVERFGLFLQTATAMAGGSHAAARATPHFSGPAGLALIALGLAMVAVATWRFVKSAREIDDPEPHAGPGSRFDLALAVLIFLLGGSLFAYLGLNLFGKS
jgi:putative membrane protein